MEKLEHQARQAAAVEQRVAELHHRLDEAKRQIGARLQVDLERDQAQALVVERLVTLEEVRAGQTYVPAASARAGSGASVSRPEGMRLARAEAREALQRAVPDASSTDPLGSLDF